MIYIAFGIITFGFLMMVAAFNKLWGIVQVMGCLVEMQRCRIIKIESELGFLAVRVRVLEEAGNEQA